MEELISKLKEQIALLENREAMLDKLTEMGEAYFEKKGKEFCMSNVFDKIEEDTGAIADSITALENVIELFESEDSNFNLTHEKIEALMYKYTKA